MSQRERRLDWRKALRYRLRFNTRRPTDEYDKDDEVGTRLEDLASAPTADGDIAPVVKTPVHRQVSFAPSVTFGQEAATTARSRYVCGDGELSFWKNFAYEEQGRPFLRTTHDVNMEDVAAVLHDEWKIKSPRIVLVVVSNVASLSKWTNPRQMEHFQNGIIKAANTTEMWILTQGTNTGVTRLIGDAVHDELMRRQAMRCHKHPNQSRSSLPPLTLIGVAREDLLLYGDMLDGRVQRVEIENEGNQPEENKYELNSDHSHFLIVKDNTINKTGINHFMLKLEQYLATAPETASDSIDGTGHHRLPDLCSLSANEIPVVALLVQGGYECTRLILDHLKKQLPVVVVRGSGGLADLLAYAYNEVFQRPQGIQDAEFVENFLKPELSSKIVHHSLRYRDNNLARNLFRDRIMECVRYAHQNGQVYLTVLNLHSHSCNLENLDEYLLKALFKSQKPNTSSWHAQMQKDLYLTLDWNSPHVAMSEVFLKDPSNKFKVDKSVFEQALTRANRENFVDLFLNQGFQIHKYLTPRRFKLLFIKSQNQEFFRTICWENALGHSLMSTFGKNFIETDLNWLIEMCTGIPSFINTQEMSLNAMAMYATDPSDAERKSLSILAMWAVFTGQPKLAKILWRHSDQPIHLALVLSMIYDRLQDYVHDSTARQDVQNLSREFSDMATGVLDASFKDSSCRAYDVLCEENPDWSYKTAVDIAADGKNRSFLSHPCCQKWLTQMFLGDIRIREVTWGVITFPQWLKIVLCAFLILPMYIWVRFKTEYHHHAWDVQSPIEESEDDRDERDAEDANLMEDNVSEKASHFSSRKHSVVFSNANDSKGFDFGHGKHREQMATMLREKEIFIHSPPPIWKMIYMMWSAPITKFWTFQIFYMIYLGFFCLAVLWPSCGNKYLDIVVCSWTSLIVVEYMRRTYILYRKYTSVPLFFKCVEILFIIIFIILYLLGRIINVGVFLNPYNGKVLLCIGLLYFFYRLIAVYLPISPTLGPLLYRVKLMVLVDFVNFMRMTLLVIISGGVVIHAVLYPDFPLSTELFRRTFHRAWFSLFLTPISDLETEDRCNASRRYFKDPEYCLIGNYFDYTCPNTGLWPYVFSIQYFVFLKLILLTLLYALFSATASKLQSETDAIWKFQRYQLVVDFANRLRLPPPLSLISYLLTVFNWLYRCLTCKVCKKADVTDAHIFVGGPGREHRLSEKDYNYWRQLAQEYSKEKAEKEEEKDIAKKQLEIIMTITEDVDYEKLVLRQLKGRVRELERMVAHSHVHLENIKHLMQKAEDHGVQADAVIHVLARHTPYPGTRVQRFPVPDKYVPWEVLWTDYDPVAYSRPKSDFPVSLQPYVDEDILLLREQQGVDLKMPVFQWNCVSVNAAGISIDRESWILGEDGSNVIFKLDSESVPRNIFGRCGLRGRGALPRWGPNHYIYVIITRWQKGGGRGLEFVVMRGDRRDQLSLPGGFVPGEHQYEIFHQLFKSKDATPSVWEDSTHMIEFFQSCQHLEVPEEGDPVQVDIKSEMIKRGYMDDPWNTDHAWREVELWHVHFTASEMLSEYFQAMLSWRLITEDVFIKMPTGQAVLLQEITQKLKPVIF